MNSHQATMTFCEVSYGLPPQPKIQWRQPSLTDSSTNKPSDLQPCVFGPAKSQILWCYLSWIPHHWVKAS